MGAIEPRRRRTSAQVEARLRAGALSVFAAQGYEGATTRAIAEEADVSEAMIFRHFGSKAKLFRAVVLQPLDSLLEKIVSTWVAARSGGDERGSLLAVWAHTLLVMVRAHRDPLRAWMAGRPPRDELTELPEVDVEARAAFGMVLSLVVLDRWMWSGADEPPPQRLAEAVVALLTWGIAADQISSGMPNRR